MRSSTIKGIFFIIAVVGAIVTFFFTQLLIERVREQQRQKVDLWVKSLKLLTETENTGELSFIFTEIVSVIDFPAILSDANMQPVTWKNIAVDTTLTDAEQKAFLSRLITDMDEKHPPVAVKVDTVVLQYIHYGDSDVVVALQIAPLVAGGAVALFILIAYLSFSAIRKTEASSIWVGMAKETAHQLGTPISSLIGWIELMKGASDNPERQAQVIFEMQTDVNRLNRVATRFSKIGSKETLAPENIAAVLEHTFDYYRQRLPQMGKTISLDIKDTNGSTHLVAHINRELMEWVFENITKNGIDAIEGHDGKITATILDDGEFISVDISDNGKGIEAKNRREIFRPGFSTKARGWGLGLTLAKRIVEDYHKGKLLLKETAVGKGTTFRIKLKKHL
ncbi:MAG: hypothetical protein HY22_04725 [[Candidatus Thermochlorobacteriaceae] bacterium GBChlB]|nr:MAG: hypothetical protein HY22_04725 [[Candidatus Thermochlorobacteriaceae] bacterium GBChlB]